ncbi:MAG: hypothetical protein R3A48_20890 [Polyangiales bacterium]
MKTLYLLMGLAAIAAMGCSDDDVGSPCAPSRPQGQRCDGEFWGRRHQRCFLGSEVYIEPSRCSAARITINYCHFSETTDVMAREAAAVYCDAAAASPLRATTDPSVLCVPTGFTCVTNLAGEQYSEGVRGSYCVRSETLTP